METNIVIGILAVIVLVAMNGFFVAAEFALVSVRKTRIEQLVSEGSGSARIVQGSLIDLDRYIAGTQVGITLASLALGWVGEPAVASLINPLLHSIKADISAETTHSIAVAIAFIGITFLHVILGELVPKSIALQKPEATSLILARPLAIVVTLFRPLIWSLNGLGNLLLRAIRMEPAHGHDVVHSAKELELLVRESHRAGVLDDLEKRMLQRTFRFSETSVSEVMVPRSQMQAIDLRLPKEDFFNKAAESRHTRLPVYEDNIDRISGVIYLYELFRMSRREDGDLRSCVRPALFVPESLRLDDMIKQFRTQNTQIAVVIDEHGGTAGLLTLEDVVEAVFGKIQDLNDKSEPDIVPGEKGVNIVRGDARLAVVNDVLGTTLDSPEVDTIGGFIMHTLGRVPKKGDAINVKGWKIVVEEMDRVRVTKVALIPERT